MNKSTFALSVVMATSTLAYAEGSVYSSSWYAGAGLTTMNYEEEFLSQNLEFDLTALSFKVGYQIAPAAALEVRFGFGLSDDSDDFSFLGSSYDAELELDSYYGLYTKFGLPNSSAVYPYIILGFSDVEMEVSFPDVGLSDSGSDSDFSYGVGVDINVSDSVSFYAEYMNWYDKNSVEISGFNIGGAVRF